MPASDAFKLTIRQGPRPNQTYELDKDVYAIGREAGNDLVIEDAQVSRRHARLTKQGNSYLLEDLGSTNGTFVNGSRVTAPVLLANGDLIGLADTVVIEAQAPMLTDVNATLVGRAADAEPTSIIQGPPTTVPSFTPVQAPKATAPLPQQPSSSAPPVQSSYPPAPKPITPPPPQVQTADNRRVVLIACGCLALLAIVAVIGLVAWSFIDCRSFSSVLSFLFPPLQC